MGHAKGDRDYTRLPLSFAKPVVSATDHHHYSFHFSCLAAVLQNNEVYVTGRVWYAEIRATAMMSHRESSNWYTDLNYFTFCEIIVVCSCKRTQKAW